MSYAAIPGCYESNRLRLGQKEGFRELQEASARHPPGHATSASTASEAASARLTTLTAYRFQLVATTAKEAASDAF
jgi:hypothetical protein